MKAKSHEYYMDLAIREAIKARDIGEVPIGALLVMNDHIISKSYNQVELLTDSTAHAEILAITAAYHSLGTKYLPDATLYVTVEPCIMCAGALYWGKLGSVVYGASDNRNGYSRFLQKSPGLMSENINSQILHPKTKVITGVCSAACTDLIQDFFRSKRS